MFPSFPKMDFMHLWSAASAAARCWRWVGVKSTNGGSTESFWDETLQKGLSRTRLKIPQAIQNNSDKHWTDKQYNAVDCTNNQTKKNHNALGRTDAFIDPKCKRPVVNEASTNSVNLTFFNVRPAHTQLGALKTLVTNRASVNDICRINASHSPSRGTSGPLSLFHRTSHNLK